MKALCLVAICSGLVGCMAIMGIKQVPLVHSSLDANNGMPHSSVIKGSSPADLIPQVVTLAEKRDFVLVNKSCVEDGCRFELKSKPRDRAKTVGSGMNTEKAGSSQVSTYNLVFASRIFGITRAVGDGAKIEMIGVPVINNTPSCPPVLEQGGHCKPEMFNVQGDQTPAQSFKGIWGEDISGTLEAEVITGILSELG